METKKVLVTGGAGFIGSHLCKYLLDRNYEVICLDNFFTGNKKNILPLIHNHNFELVRHDLSHPIHLEVDQIYNLACPASPIHYQYNPIKTIKMSTIGVIHMLGLAKRVKARILQASTSEVYGDPKEHPQKESYVGNVNPIGIRSCFSEDTEILTDDGWKLFKDLTKDDKILTLGENDYIKYHKPTEIIKERYEGELIEFKNSKIDLLVTPNHKMYVKKRGKKNFDQVSAFENIRWERSNMKKDARWNGSEKKYFYLPKVKNNKFGDIKKINMDVWLEFFGYYITEGCVYLRKRVRNVKGKNYNTLDYNILIAQDKKNELEREKITNCLKKMPFTFFSSDDHQFRICNKQLALYLIKFGKAKEKYIPKELKNVSERQLRILFGALMLGDGSKKGETFYSSSYKLISDFQEILLKIKIGGSIFENDKRKKNSVYSINILKKEKKNFLTPKYPKRVIKKYNGFVYCVNVPSHVIYVRRNGKALFCGNCYDEGKRVAETLFMDYHRQNKVDIKIARIFNTYGPNMSMNDGRVMSNFIIQALKGEPITIYGDGNQTRSFCYVSDLVEGLYKLMNKEDFTGPVNLGNPGEITMKELAEKIIEFTGTKSEIIHKELPQDDPVRRCPDITLAKEKLEWQPKVKWEHGLMETINYFKSVLRL